MTPPLQIYLPTLLAASMAASSGALRGVGPEEGAAAVRAPSTHLGPPVAPAETGSEGPARYVGALFDVFDTGQAMEDAVFIDGFYRTPASPLYDAVIDRLAARLREAGFGRSEGLTLRIVSTEREGPAWWPLSALLEARSEAGSETLLAFASPGDEHRTMLPVGAPGADVEGPVAFTVDELEEGGVLVTRAPLSGPMLLRAKSRGARAVLSASLFSFTVDPNGDRHLDAIKFSKMPRENDVPVAKISPRALARIEDLHAADPGTRLRFRARVATANRPLRTLVAEIVGADLSGEAVAIASHLQEPGAGDNAAGAAGLASSACAIAKCLREGSFERPSRTLAFVFGDEMVQSSIWLEHSGRTTVAALSADMLGQSPERTGSIALLERTPDPGALYTIPPDEHTPWGAGRVAEDDLVPNPVNLVCRQALADVAALRAPDWRTSENPWEGGSDHDVFNARRIPAALMWHFTDFTYHTSLDRMSMIDTAELRRTCAAISGAGLALADTRRADLPRLIASNEMERELRVGAAEELGNAAAVDAWNVWCDGVVDALEAFVVD
ncbi:MAG: hypothetical protein AAGB93_19695 [Planctomycetota bacterium]